jgi:hypothetical protein
LGKGVISDARWEVYKKQKGLFEPLEPPFEGGPHLVVKTDGPAEEVVRKVVERVIAGNVIV